MMAVCQLFTIFVAEINKHYYAFKISKRTMKRIFHVLILWTIALSSWAQGVSALDQVKADPRKAYGTDYP